jgi:hypothetical protein
MDKAAHSTDRTPTMPDLDQIIYAHYNDTEWHEQAQKGICPLCVEPTSPEPYEQEPALDVFTN